MPNASNTPDRIDQMFHGYMQAHEDLINKMRSIIVPKTPIDKGAFLDEYVSTGASPLIFTPAIDRPALINYIILSYTPVGAATLTIGQSGGTSRNIPIIATNNFLPMDIQCAMVIKPGDILTLTASGATSLFLEIMGNSLSGTDWSLI